MDNTTTAPTVDIATIRRAFEGNDAALLTSLYADDAEIRIVDKTHPPRSPWIMRGKEEINRYFQDICGRGLSHFIHNEVIAPERIAFTESCAYPDGTNVLCATVLTLGGGGRIVEQTGVQAWDE